MLRGTIVLMFCASGWVCGQSADARPAFEVATIKPSGPDGIRMPPIKSGGPGTPDPSRVNLQFFSLANLVMLAYTLHPYQLSGPSWLETERFDIVAKVADGATKEQVPLMVQGLLAERFHLMLHRDKKEGTVYDLVVGKIGPKMLESVERPATKGGPEPPPPTLTGASRLDGDEFPVLRPAAR
jgi:uncharacterized protein (TIGR03435 family)